MDCAAPAGRIYVVAGMRDSEPLKECECYSVDTYRPAGCICCTSARPLEPLRVGHRFRFAEQQRS